MDQRPPAAPAVVPIPLAGVYAGFDVRVSELTIPSADGAASFAARFFYLTFRGREPTLDEFVEFIYWRIVPFCIPRTEREAKEEAFRRTNDYRYAQELIDKARMLFVKSLQSLETSGEPAELILFVLLEAALQAPQIVCKMYLKTSENVPVHGADGIHLLVSSDGAMCLLWGESKLNAKLSSALDSIVESLSTFLGRKTNDRAPRAREIDIIRDHISLSDPTQRDALLSFFDPYAPESNQRNEAHACLACFDFAAYGDMAGHSDDATARSAFLERYRERVGSACKLFTEKIAASDLQHLSLHFFLLPFPSVADLRTKFFAKLGISGNAE